MCFGKALKLYRACGMLCSAMSGIVVAFCETWEATAAGILAAVSCC